MGGRYKKGSGIDLFRDGMHPRKGKMKKTIHPRHHMQEKKRTEDKKEEKATRIAFIRGTRGGRGK